MLQTRHAECTSDAFLLSNSVGWLRLLVLHLARRHLDFCSTESLSKVIIRAKEARLQHVNLQRSQALIYWLLSEYHVFLRTDCFVMLRYCCFFTHLASNHAGSTAASFAFFVCKIGQLRDAGIDYPSDGADLGVQLNGLRHGCSAGEKQQMLDGRVTPGDQIGEELGALGVAVLQHVALIADEHGEALLVALQLLRAIVGGDEDVVLVRRRASFHVA